MSLQKTLYVIQYQGPDIPGLLHATSKCISSEGFNIIDVSTSSGADNHSTFITCVLFTNADISPQRKKVRLRNKIDETLNKEYEKYAHENDTAKPFHIPVTVNTVVVNEQNKYRVYLDFVFPVKENKPGLLAAITDLIKDTFSIDNSVMRLDSGSTYCLSVRATRIVGRTQAQPGNSREIRDGQPDNSALIKKICDSVYQIDSALCDSGDTIKDRIQVFKRKLENVLVEWDVGLIGDKVSLSKYYQVSLNKLFVVYNCRIDDSPVIIDADCLE